MATANKEKTERVQNKNLRPFKPGQSGNPKGRPKDTDAVKAAKEGLYRLTPTVVDQMEEALLDPNTPLNVKMKIWEIVLDRSLGKAAQPIIADIHNSEEPVTLQEMMARARELLGDE